MSKKKNKQQETVVEPPAQSPTTPQQLAEWLAGWVFEENRATLRHVLDGVA